jgi:hypothetical protein
MEPSGTQNPSLAPVTHQLTIARPLKYCSIRIILVLCHLHLDLPATVQYEFLIFIHAHSSFIMSLPQ